MGMVEAVARVEQLRAQLGIAPATSASPAAAAGTAATTSTASASTGTGTLTAFSEALASARTPVMTGTAPATPTGALPADVPADLAPLITRAAEDNGLDPSLVAAVARAESGYRVDAGSPAGARGLMQLMPSTAAGLGVTDILDPAQNLNAGARYLRQQLDRFGDVRLALAAYNAGPGAVSRYGGIPPYDETRTYVDRVMGYYDPSGTAAGV